MASINGCHWWHSPIMTAIVRARPIEIIIKKRWFLTLKPRISIKKVVLGMIKSNLDALAPCALKSSESFFVRINFGKKEFNWKASCKTIKKWWICNPSKTYQSLVEKLFSPMSFDEKIMGGNKIENLPIISEVTLSLYDSIYYENLCRKYPPQIMV